jgi:hypothetical protein
MVRLELGSYVIKRWGLTFFPAPKGCTVYQTTWLSRPMILSRCAGEPMSLTAGSHDFDGGNKTCPGICGSRMHPHTAELEQPRYVADQPSHAAKYWKPSINKAMKKRDGRRSPGAHHLIEGLDVADEWKTSRFFCSCRRMQSLGRRPRFVSFHLVSFLCRFTFLPWW